MEQQTIQQRYNQPLTCVQSPEEVSWYKIGTIFLKSNVTIELGQNGKISDQTDRKYYAEATYKQLYEDEQHTDLCLFYAEQCKNICIKGQGIIDGRDFLNSDL